MWYVKMNVPYKWASFPDAQVVSRLVRLVRYERKTIVLFIYGSFSR